MAQNYTDLLRQRMLRNPQALNSVAAMARGGGSDRPTMAPGVYDVPGAQGPRTYTGPTTFNGSETALAASMAKLRAAQAARALATSGGSTAPTQPPGVYDVPGAQGPGTYTGPTTFAPPAANRPRGLAGTNQVPEYQPYAPDVAGEQARINTIASEMTASDPLVSAVTDPIGTARGIVQAWLTVSDIPRQWSTEQIGDQVYQLATGAPTPDWLVVLPGGDKIWTELQDTLSPESKASIIAAYTSGGGRGVWEDTIAAATDEMPWWLKYPIRAGTDILVDPLGYPLMVATMGGDVLLRGALESAAGGDVARAAIQKVVGSALTTPQKVLDYTIDAPFNAAGDVAGKVLDKLRGTRFAPVAEQFGETASSKATDAVNLTDEAIRSYTPARDGIGFDTPTSGAADLPDMPRYTMKQEQDAWVIYDPQGVRTGETFPYDPKTGVEPNMAERTAQRAVNDLNRPLVRAEEEAAGAVLPPVDAGLTWTAPNYDRLTRRGKDLGTTIQHVVAYDNTLDPATRRAWMDAWTPKALEHERVMADIAANERQIAAQTGQSLERDFVQRQREIVSVPKTYETVRFVAEDTLLPFKQAFPDTRTPAYRWITSPTLDPANPSNLIEHAVFGTRDDAIMARKLIRQQGITVEGFRSPVEFADNLARIGEELNGAGWRSTNPAAIKSRGVRAARAAEPIPNDAAVNELTNTSPRALDQPSPKLSVSEAIAPQPPEPKGRKPTARVDVNADDRTVVAQLQDPAMRWRTPNDNLIKRVQGGEVQVRLPGRRGEPERMARLIPSERGGETIWDVQIGYGRGETVRLATLGDAISVADELLLRLVKGIDPAPEQIKLALDDLTTLGVISPESVKVINLEGRVRKNILRAGNALEGPGGTDLLSRGDPSLLGSAHQMGAIDTATYLELTKPVSYNGQQMRVWEAYERALLDAPIDMTTAEQEAWARKIVAQGVIDPEIKQVLRDQRLAVEARSAGVRRIYRALGAYQRTLKYQREAIMFNWARGWSSAFADSVGNSFNLLIHGEYEAAARNYDPSIIKIFLADERGKMAAFENLPEYARIKYITGKEPPPSVVQLVETKFETGHGKLELQKITGKLYPIFRPISDADIMAFRTAMDRSSRYGLYVGSFNRYLSDAQIEFRGIVATRAERLGNDPTAWLRVLDDLGPDYNGTDVLKAFGDNRLARDWAELANGARGKAKRRVEELLLSYKQTNLDNKLRNVIFFHYWMSRAMVVHAKAALKNPWLINAYARAWQAMEREAEQNGYPPNVRGYIKMMGDKSGMMGLINPVNVLVPFAMLIDSQVDEGTLAFLKRWGLFITPLIEGGAAALGWTNTLPDVTGTRQIRRAARVTVNWLNSNGFDGVVPDWLGDPNTWQGSMVDEAQYRIVNAINGYAQRAANAIAPGQQIVGKFEGSSPNAYEQDVLRSITITYLEARYGPFETWTAESSAWDDLEQVIDDISSGRNGNPLADAVVEQYADDRAKGVLWNAVLPGGLYQRYGPRDATLADARAGDQAAWDMRSLETTGNVPLTIQLQQLDRLGTEDGRWGYKQYNEIVYGDLPPSEYIAIGNDLISTGDIERMTTEQRKQLANRWLAQYIDPSEVEDYQSKRADFLATHPEAGDFKEYQKGIHGYDGGVTAWRTAYAKTDPAFSAAMAAVEKKLRAQGKTGAVLAAELDRWADTPEAYNVIHGIANEIYDAPTTEKTPNLMLGSGAAGGGGGTSTPKTPAEKMKASIESYQRKVAEAIDAMKAAGYAVTPDDVYSSNPYYQAIFDQYGVPSMPDDVYYYLLWSSMNPGADTSVDAYLRYLDQLGQRAA